MSCQMTLNNLQLPVNLGWQGDERAKPQLVSINITLIFNTPPTACQTDLLEDTFCYHALTDALKQGIGTRSFRLIECLAVELHRLAKKGLPEGINVHLHITKKPAIADLLGGVSFSYGDAL